MEQFDISKASALSVFTEKEIMIICRMITAKEIRAYFQKHPNEFAKIRSGFRASSLSDDDAVTLACKNMARPFVSSFVKKWIAVWLMQIQNECSELEQNGASPDEALLQTLPRSVFSENIDLFFKATNKDYSVEYTTLAKAALSLLERASQLDDSENISELSSIQQTNAELQKMVADLQLEIESEKASHTETNRRLVQETAKKDMLQQDLETTLAQVNLLTEKKISMQAELDNFYQLSKYADTEVADTYDDKYQFTSLCQVVWGYQEKPWLFRLADIRDGKIEYFKKKEEEPFYFSNRDRLFWTNGPKEDGVLGVWQWNAEPNKADPSTDYVTTEHNSTAKIIEIIELDECHSCEDISSILEIKSFKTTIGNKVLFACKNTDGQMIGLLCHERDFDRNNGDAKLKSTVYTLPIFEISSFDILTIAGKKVYRFVSLGLPQGIFRTRNPLTVVKEIIIKRATIAALRQQGLSKKEAQYCQRFLKELPVESLCQEIVDAYSCTEVEAREYIANFLSQSDTYLSECDIDLGTLAAALERNNALVEKCKDLLAAEWETENSEKLQEAQQQFDDIEKEAAARRMEIDNFESEYRTLQNKVNKIQADIEAQKNLASDVELKVKQRIAAAKQNAADFICEMAFSTSNPALANTLVPETLARRENETLVLGKHIESSPEKLESINDLVSCLEENLRIAGVSTERCSALASYLLAAYTTRTPLIFAGYGADLILDALSSTLVNTTAHRIYASRDIDVSKLAQLPRNEIVIIYNPFQSSILPQLMSAENSPYICFGAITTEEMIIEPSGLYSYSLPIFADYLLETRKSEDFEGYICTIKPEMGSAPRNNISFPTNILPKYARNLCKELSSGISSKVIPVYDLFFLQIIPIMVSLNQREKLCQMIAGAALTDKEKNTLQGLVEDYDN